MSVRNTNNTKFLIIRFSAFGDVVQTLSIPSAIRDSYPQAEIHWLTRKDMSQLLEGHPHIDRIWSFDRSLGMAGLFALALNLRDEKFTHIYDAHNNSRSHITTFILRPWGFLGCGPLFIRRSIRRWKRFLLFTLRKNTFEQPFSGQRDLLEPLAPWGISKIAPPAPQLFPSRECLNIAQELLGDFAGAVALAPSAAYPLKRWPLEHWKMLVQLCPEQKFVLLGGPEDLFLEEIQKIAPERVLNLAGKCSLQVSSAAVFYSQVTIANDTGLLHVAEQLGKQTIALMGPAPFGFPSRPSTTILELNLSCRPCSKHGQGPCVNKEFYQQCLAGITPETVATVLLSKLKESTP